MPKAKTKKRQKNTAGADARRETYKGHEILVPEDQRRKKIFVDGRPVKWGNVGGKYYLDVYAYDPGKSLDDTVKRYIDSLERRRKARKEAR